MSRFSDKDLTPILKAGHHWAERCLRTSGSVLSDESLWTLELVDAIDRFFVQSPDEGEDRFLDKLKSQLAPADPAANKLAAEMMWVLYLCPSNVRPPHKRSTVAEIWSWSGDALRQESPWFDDATLGGIGSAGAGFNHNQWRELVYLVNFTKRFLGLTTDERTQLLADPRGMSAWLEEVPGSESRQARHMLLFLLFPDSFERIFGTTDRRKVVRAFSDGLTQPVTRLSQSALDQALTDIRKKLEAQYGTQDLDFYLPPLKDQWASRTLAEKASGLEHSHVLEALKSIDDEGVPDGAESTGYDLIYGERRYPPKLVLSKAVEIATGSPLERREFTGGDSSQAFRVLRNLGFEIEAKDPIPHLIEQFLGQARAATNLATRGYLDTYRGLHVSVSFGRGNFARIPWIAFLAPGQNVSEGVYPVFLFFKEQQLLLLCYGISEENAAALEWPAACRDTTVRDWLLKERGVEPDRYGASFVRRAFDVSKTPDVQYMRSELDAVIAEYKLLIDHKPEDPGSEATLQTDLEEISDAFAAALKDSFLDFGAEHEQLVRALLAALATKPFAILTGLSGSGKTQIALRLGEWFGPNRLYVAAVRPDWTGAEALFGFEDALKAPVDGRAAWNVPGPLEFILAAAKDPQNPYLLLLDEMNLAHVERYFADVLSGMESKHACIPNLTKTPKDGHWRVDSDGQSRIPFPRNLFVIGTVNIDETTYVFSPKVLDRANTFEFRVSANDLRIDGRKPVACEPGDAGLVRGFLAISRDDAWQDSRPASYRDWLADALRDLHVLLARHSMEFGQRVFYESLRFAAFAEAAGFPSRELVLDRVLLQKILPRLHGSRRKLELPLVALQCFARSPGAPVPADDKLLAIDVASAPGPVALPATYSKLTRMLAALRMNQFVSFTE